MNNQGSKHGGAYLQAPSQRKCYSKFAFLVGVFMVIIASILFVLLKSEATEDRIVYHLPDEAPVINLPETLEDNSDSRNLDDLVDPYFNFIIEAGNHSIDVSLPILKAAYGSDFNASVMEQLETIVSDTLYHLENDICIYKSMSYEAYLDQEIITILLHTEYTDGQSRCQPWIFDLTKGGVLVNDTSELTERLLGMDYASFLFITDRYIQNLFADTYFNDVYSVSEEDMTNEQYEFLDSYRGIVREIPRDISNAFSRWIFPADGKVFLVFQFPIISNGWYVGFLSETAVVEINETILKHRDLVTPEEAVLEAVLDSTVHVMGGTDWSHALLTRTVFFSSPDVFISAAARVPETDQEYMIESLIGYADETDCTKIFEICKGLKASENLSDSKSEVVERIANEIIDER